MKNSHAQRILTALALLPLLGWAVYAGGAVLAMAITLVACLGLLEFYAMFWPGRSRTIWKGLGTIVAAGMIWAPASWSGSALIFPAGLIMAAGFLVRYTKGDTDNLFADSQVFLFGLIYLPLVLRLAGGLHAAEIVLILLTTFAADTGAYYSGSFFGGPKIWPAVSPKKTWAGSIGGLLASSLVCTAIGTALGSAHWTNFALLGAGLNIAAQSGDFFESALKRLQGIKDSGWVLPGHGGVLDRIDSLLFVLPVYCAAKALYPFFG